MNKTFVMYTFSGLRKRRTIYFLVQLTLILPIVVAIISDLQKGHLWKHGDLRERLMDADFIHSFLWFVIM